MNLYKLHTQSEELVHHDIAHDNVPKLFWDKYKNNPTKLKKREAALAKDPKYAFLYANYILNKPFPAGEAVIAKDAHYAYEYARYVLKGPFKAGEAALAKDPKYAFLYANSILKGPFKAGEVAIAKDVYFAKLYANICKRCV